MSKYRYYAGIGSRKTPIDILDEMRITSRRLADKGYILRSGNALGADRAFEYGLEAVEKQIFLARDATLQMFNHAKAFHPAWGACNPYAQRLHARNSAIMLGKDLDHPVDFVICWTPGGKEIGGTSQALRIAKSMDIPIFNMFFNVWDERLKAKMEF